MIRTIEISHECAIGCWKCYGSGEGWSENASCTACHGRGYTWNRGEIEELFEVEWTKGDLSDLNIIDGYDECERCGADMIEIIKESLHWELEHEQTGKS